MRVRLLAAALAALTFVPAAQAAEDAIPYPEGFRSMFHVKSMVILDGHALAGSFKGIHHIYANDAALQGYRTGEWPDGALLVFDLLEHVEGGDALVEGARRLTGVMLRDASRFAATGGWGYEGFEGDSKTERLVTDMAGQCHGCHAQQEKTGFVFSTLRK